MGGIHAVVPVKSLADAKSRLSDRFTQTQRRDLVLAMLADTLNAATAAEQIARVSVVTGDPVVAEAARRLGVETLREPASKTTLNDALSWALGEVTRNGAQHVLILQADLPAVTASQLAEFTRSDPRAERIFVADQHGTGTTALLVRTAPDRFRPQFGVNSADRHRHAGARPVDGNWPGLRHDVDTAADLDAAVALGIGRATMGALAAYASTQS